MFEMKSLAREEYWRTWLRSSSEAEPRKFSTPLTAITVESVSGNEPFRDAPLAVEPLVAVACPVAPLLAWLRFRPMSLARRS